MKDRKRFWVLSVLLIGGVSLLGGSALLALSRSQTATKAPKDFSMNIQKEFDLPTSGAAVAVAWSPDGSALAAASNFGGVLTVWDSSGHLINQFKRVGGGPALNGSIAFIDGSSKLVFLPPEKTDDRVALTVWDVASGEVVKNVNGPVPDEGYSHNRAGHFMVSPAQTVAAAGSDINGNLITYSLPDWRPLQTAKIKQGVFSLCLFDNGQLTAVGSNLGFVTVIDTRTGALISQFRAYEESRFGSLFLGAIAGSPDGQLLFAGIGQANLNGPYFKSDEALIWQKSIPPARLLRAQDGEVIASFADAVRPIRQAKWDPRGRYVAFIDNNRSLFIWRPGTAFQDYKKVDLPSPSLSLDITSDGRRIAVATNQGIRIYLIH